MHVHLNSTWTVELLEKFIERNRGLIEAEADSAAKSAALSRLKAAEELTQALRERGGKPWASPEEFHAFLREVITRAAKAQGKAPPADLDRLSAHELLHPVYGTAVDAIRTPADLREMTYDFLRRSHEQGVIYAELSTSGLNNVREEDARLPERYAQNVQAICEAIEQAKKDFGIEARVVVTAKRHLGPERAGELLDACLAHRRDSELARRYVTGWGMAGNEHSYDLAQFGAVYMRARAAGLGTTVHVGEVEYDSREKVITEIRNAIEVLGVDRIGHGLRAAENPALCWLIREGGVAIEQCPTSNHFLENIIHDKANGDWRRHPLRRFLNAGCAVMLGTDDPALLFPALNGQSTAGIADEYAYAKNHLGLSQRGLTRLTRNAVAHGFIDMATKHRLLAAIDGQNGPGWRMIGRFLAGRSFSSRRPRASTRSRAFSAHCAQ